MNPENEGNLAALLREALKGVTVTHSRFDPIHLSDYSQMVSRNRLIYEPNLRIYVSLYDIQIKDARIAEAILNLLRTELSQFIRNDKTFFASLSASTVIVSSADSESPIEIILKNLTRAAIVDGPDNAAREFYACIARGYLLFQNYYLLTGIKVEKEVRVLDGISLIPLPNSTADLPGYLPVIFDVSAEEFVSKTLLKIDVSVPLTLHEPTDGYILARGPEQRFRMSVHSVEVEDFYPQRFFQALTIVGEQPVQDAIMWRHFSDDRTFDLRRVTSFSFFSPSALRVTTTTNFSEAQIRQAIDLYHKIVGLSQNVLDYLEIPIDRWKKSKTQQGYVDKMIDLGIAFESFLLRGISQGVTFRFSLRGSLYLEEGMEERTRLNKELEAIYKYRSRAVHEGTLPDKVTVNGENVPMGQFIKRSQDLFKRCLLKVIESHQLPDWRTIELGGGAETDDRSSGLAESPPIGNSDG